MSDLLKLENIRLRNGDIKAFPISSNMKKVNMLGMGWGEIIIAIDNISASRLITRENDLLGVLYLVSRDEWENESKNLVRGDDIENKKQATV